jgi:hypothetical protein
VQSCSSKVFIRYYLSCGSLHQRGASQEDSTLLVYHDDLVTHGWDVGTTGGATSEHDSDLWDTLAGHPCLVVKDSSKMIPVRKNIILLWQKGTCRVDHVNARQIVLFRNLLGPQVLLYRDRVVGTSLITVIVGDHHALLATNTTYARDDVSAGNALLWLHILVACELPNLDEGRTLVQYCVDPLSRQQLVPLRRHLSLLLANVKRLGNDSIELTV